MSLRATSIGNLAARVLSRNRTGEVTRVFQRSVYLRSGNSFILLLWGTLRSPMTINVEESHSTERRIRVGDRGILSGEAVKLGAMEIDLREAELFRSALLKPRKITLPEGPALTKGVAMLRSLYDSSPSGPVLASDPNLKSFVKETLLPLSSGKTEALYRPAQYLGLIGRGGGFTPAGDDFVGAHLATFNYIARCKKKRQVTIPRDFVRRRTIPESAAILSDSARGHVDEGMEKLILASTGRSEGFYGELMGVVRRGHTSGIDMSLGVLLCEAALAQAEGKPGALQNCLDALWKA
jgi:ASC-1-like (ASCH) protein